VVVDAFHDEGQPAALENVGRAAGRGALGQGQGAAVHVETGQAVDHGLRADVHSYPPLAGARHQVGPGPLLPLRQQHRAHGPGLLEQALYRAGSLHDEDPLARLDRLAAPKVGQVAVGGHPVVSGVDEADDRRPRHGTTPGPVSDSASGPACPPRRPSARAERCP
jgi:hypothetical protein